MRQLRLAVLLVLVLLAGQRAGSGVPSVPVPPRIDLSRIPLHFVETAGPGFSGHGYEASGAGYRVAFAGTTPEIRLRHAGASARVRIEFPGSDPDRSIEPVSRLAGVVSDLRGSDSRVWRRGMATYARLRVRSVYPGVDIEYYGRQNELEYDFVVQPAADTSRIRVRFDGLDEVELGATGELTGMLPGGRSIVQRKPVAYQEREGRRIAVDVAYRKTGQNEVTFELGSYDPGHVLVIDPVLSYASYLGGADGDDEARAIAVDSTGSIYVTGSTNSTNFPTVSPLQPSNANGADTGEFSDVFVAKLNAAGSSLVYATYLGGSSDDDGRGIAVDTNGSAVITGRTLSTDFPVSASAVRRTCNLDSTGGCEDAFAVKLNATGSGLTYSTYLGGAGNDEGRGVALDAAGNAYVAGATESTNLPVTSGVFGTAATRGFLTKLTPSGAVSYWSYVAAGAGIVEVNAVAVDGAGNAVVSGGFTATGAATRDAFVARVNAIGSAVTFTGFLRGDKDDVAYGVSVDASGGAVIAGGTASINLQTTAGAVQSRYAGGPLFRAGNVGGAWSNASSGLTRASAFALASSGGLLYAGTDDDTTGGVFRSADRGATWTVTGSGMTDTRVHALATDPMNPDVVWAGTRTGVFRSGDRGGSWSSTGKTSGFINALVVCPCGSATVFAATDSGLFRTTDNGATWVALTAGLVSPNVKAIAIDPSNNAVMYAGTGGGIFKSINGGASWVSSSFGLFDPNINALVIDPRSPNTVYAATNSVGVFRSLNGGGFWIGANTGLVSSSAGIQVTALVVDAQGTLHAGIGEGNASGTFRSSSGTSWTATGLQSSRVNALLVDGTALVAATSGGTDAFIARFSASGSLVFSSYLGGARDDVAYAAGVDSSMQIHAAGTTGSPDFPTSNPVQATFGGMTDAFVSKVAAGGGAFVYSTLIGGSSSDTAYGLALDAGGNAYVAGQTGSADFPVIAGAFNARPGITDAFIAKIVDRNDVPYGITARGGFSASTAGAQASTGVGYGRIQAQTGGTHPNGLAIFGFRSGGVLVSEAAVPAVRPISSGRIYAEVGSGVNTGLAIANPGSTASTVSFFFTDSNGTAFGQGSTTLAPGAQIAAFLDQAPFNGGSSINGTMTFSASAPVAVTALRGLTNERGEFLITTLPVADPSAPPVSAPLTISHFADGGGWTTQTVLVNPGDTVLSGSVQFWSGGSAAASGQPLTLMVNGQSASSFSYSIPPRSARSLRTSGGGVSTITGSVRITPATGITAPVGLGIFAFRNASVTVSEAGVPAIVSGQAFRLYAESIGNFAARAVGSGQTGIAVANSGSTPAVVNFELNALSGASTGLTGTLTVPGNGQTPMFLGEVPGLAALPSGFQGVLRISTSAPSGVTVVGLRGRYNERGDFLITTTSPSPEGPAASTSELVFPHFADGGGYTTQFVLFNGSTDQSYSGSVRFFGQSGQPLSLALR